MGIQTFLLDRKRARLTVGGSPSEVGMLRRFWKVTELDQARRAEMAAAERTAKSTPSPPAAMIADVSECIGCDGSPRSAHLVLGWDEGRGRVSDFGWDHLPTLGYAVRDPLDNSFVLHEDVEGRLVPITEHRARLLGLLDPFGRLIRRGQPTIVACGVVRPSFRGCAEAEVTFDNGKADRLLTAVGDGPIPPASWYIGKRPMDVEAFGDDAVTAA
jgi:hypothetical protein